MKILLALASSTVVLASLGLIVMGALMLPSQPAEANMAMTQKTGKGCPVCHTRPPALNDTGKKYKATGRL